MREPANDGQTAQNGPACSDRGGCVFPFSIPDQVAEYLCYFGQLKGLLKDMRSSSLQQFIMTVTAGLTSHETGANLGIELAQSGQGLRTIQAGHADVQQHGIDLGAILLINLECVLAIG